MNADMNFYQMLRDACVLCARHSRCWGGGVVTIQRLGVIKVMMTNHCYVVTEHLQGTLYLCLLVPCVTCSSHMLRLIQSACMLDK
jgi:hypothetical protein